MPEITLTVNEELLKKQQEAEEEKESMEIQNVMSAFNEVENLGFDDEQIFSLAMMLMKRSNSEVANVFNDELTGAAEELIKGAGELRVLFDEQDNVMLTEKKIYKLKKLADNSSKDELKGAMVIRAFDYGVDPENDEEVLLLKKHMKEIWDAKNISEFSEAVGIYDPSLQTIEQKIADSPIKIVK